MKITVLYDNRTSRGDLKPDWGFACLIEGLSETVLFDTGTDGSTLLLNMRALGIEPASVDAVVISHAHDDHAGGLPAFLDAARAGVRVYLLESFPRSLTDQALSRGAEVVSVSEAVEICRGATLTGELGEGEGVREQSLVLRDGKGVLVVTGCAHPGIVKTVEDVSSMTGGRVEAVLGGFHLFRETTETADGVVARLKELGVRCAAPCHCTGDAGIERFAAGYGDGHVRCDVGTVLETEEMLSGAR